ncbi:WD40 repeat domain-containing protein [Aureimonas ureilytica]|uniref:hypothetical protein n=1 Tax=Aureimonas ureilytica TaxID=401562 RepID=UPI00037FEC22|nr:hypothetical protein [Aureimonas ureilytica]
MRIVRKVLSILGGGRGQDGAPPPPLPDGRSGFEDWNAIGRTENLAVCRALDDVIDAEGETDIDLSVDSRSQGLASAVLDEVVALNAAGRWRDARKRFDPAYRPFRRQIEDVGLRTVSLLGPDRFLLRFDEGVLLIDEENADLLDDIVTFARSADRRWLALVIPSGIVVTTDLDGPAAATWNWPQDVPVDASDLRSVAIADDGRRLVIAGDEIGIWLCRDGAWTALAPRPGVGDDDDEDEADEGSEAGEREEAAVEREVEACEIGVSTYGARRARQGGPHRLDGSHVAISPDGRFVAYGWQDAWPGHYLDRVEDEGPVPLARIDAVSDYPYSVHFSRDGRSLFANSRSGANGVTQRLDLAAFEERGEWVARPVDEYLRGYSFCEIPGPSLGIEDGVVWIGGAGWSHAVRFSGGAPVFTHFFGSAITGIDYDPACGRAVVISASGMVHVMEPFAEAEPGLERGYRPRRELYRLILWNSLDRVVRW